MAKRLRVDESGLQELEKKLKELQQGNADAYVTIDDFRYPDGTSTIDVAYFLEFGTDTISETAWLRKATTPPQLERIIRKAQKKVKKFLEKNGTSLDISTVIAQALQEAAQASLEAEGMIDTGLLHNSIRGVAGRPQGG